jgi:hypothetical protein
MMSECGRITVCTGSLFDTVCYFVTHSDCGYGLVHLLANEQRICQDVFPVSKLTRPSTKHSARSLQHVLPRYPLPKSRQYSKVKDPSKNAAPQVRNGEHALRTSCLSCSCSPPSHLHSPLVITQLHREVDVGVVSVVVLHDYLLRLVLRTLA